MDKSDENDHPIAFIPKAMINDVEWQVFWLTFFLRPSHSSVDDQWHEDQKVFIKAYSCGYSSGISPDSHVSPSRPKTDVGTISGGKCNYLFELLMMNF